MAEQQDATPLIRHRGTSRAYIIGRLQRAGHADWAAAVEAGKVSAFAAACHFGWSKREPTLSGEAGNRAKRRRHELAELEGELAAPPPDRDPSMLSSDQWDFFMFGPDERRDDPFVTIEQARQAWLANRDRLLANRAPGHRPWAWHEFEAPADLPYDYDRETSLLFERGLLGESEKAELISFWRKEFERVQELDEAARRRHLKWADVPASLVKRWQRARRRAR
jgi:hypothetical protein